MTQRRVHYSTPTDATAQHHRRRRAYSGRMWARRPGAPINPLASSPRQGPGIICRASSRGRAQRTAGKLANVLSGEPDSLWFPVLAEPRRLGRRRRSATSCALIACNYPGGSNGVLVLDETGFLKKRPALSWRGAIQANGRQGGQLPIGVFLSYASPLGQVLLDRELYLLRNGRRSGALSGRPAFRRTGALRPSRSWPSRCWPALAAGVPASCGHRGQRVRGSSPLRRWLGPNHRPMSWRVSARNMWGSARQPRPGEQHSWPAGPRRGGPAQCRRRGQRPAVVYWRWAAPCRSAGTRLAPLAAGPAESPVPHGVDRLCGVCSHATPLRSGAGGGPPGPSRAALEEAQGRSRPGSVMKCGAGRPGILSPPLLWPC